MKGLLVSAAIAALSVGKLQEELKLEYEKDTLIETLALENAKEEPRKTAIDLLTNKINEADEKAKLEADEKAKLEADEKAKLEADEKAKLEDALNKTYVLSEGMSITTLAGVKTAGQVIEPKHFKDIETFENFKTKKIIIEKVEVK